MKSWMTVRVFSGTLVGAAFGLAPFLFSEFLANRHDMYFFIVLSCMMALCSMAYSVMPFHFLLFNAVTMLPFTIYLIAKPEMFHMVLVVTAIIWQVVVLAKAMRISRSVIGGDEFIFVYTHLTNQHADISVLARRILDLLAEPIPLPDHATPKSAVP